MHKFTAYSLKIILFLVIIMSNGCFTETLWDKSRGSVYEEKVSSVLISEDNTQFAIIGNKYHYIFDKNVPLFKSILISKIHPYLVAEVDELKVSEDQKIIGKIKFIIYKDFMMKKNFPKELEQEIIVLGFKKDENSWRNEFLMEFELEGKRFLAGENFKIPNQYKLNQEYAVKILEKRSTGSRNAYRIMLSPITVAADGACLAVGTGMVFGLFVPGLIWLATLDIK